MLNLTSFCNFIYTKALIVFLVFIAGLASGCCLAPSEAPVNASAGELSKPLFFEFFIGGMGGLNFRISYKNGKISYYKYRDWGLELNEGEPVIIKPTGEQWTSFLVNVNSLKACNWKKEYYPIEIIHDGTWWEIVIIFAGENKREDVISYGSNAYPPPAEFNELLKNLSELTSNPDLLHEYMLNPL